jgi:hypothetical protein
LLSNSDGDVTRDKNGVLRDSEGKARDENGNLKDPNTGKMLKNKDNDFKDPKDG